MFFVFGIILFRFLTALGELESMRHLKNEVDTVKKDVECGLQIADKSIDVEAGDRIICYTIKTEAQTIDWNPGF